MNIVVEGCAHGELDIIYNTLSFIESTQKIKIDLLICCGDFQSIRDLNDMNCMSVPDKYKALGTFHQYFNGQKKAPFKTLFIGGNHEASNYLQERYHGGWVAPNIYFLGLAGVVNIGGLRIAGLSGIFNKHHFLQGHYETMPYNSNDLRSVYHVRSFEICQLMQLTGSIDIGLSHDWPAGITYFGDAETLFRKKSFLRAEQDTFGNPPAMALLRHWQPKYWFSGHMHVKFSAIVKHENENKIDDNNTSKPKQTLFLALDKVGRGKDFLQVLKIQSNDNEINNDNNDMQTDEKQTSNIMNLPIPKNINNSSNDDDEKNVDKTNDDDEKETINDSKESTKNDLEIRIDREWLAILHATRNLFNNTRQISQLPPPELLSPFIEKSKQLVEKIIEKDEEIVSEMKDHQTHIPTIQRLLTKLSEADENGECSFVPTPVSTSVAPIVNPPQIVANPDEIPLDLDSDDDDDDDDDDEKKKIDSKPETKNNEEINLDDLL